MNNDIDIILEEDKEIIINITDGIDGKDGKSLHPAGEWNNSTPYDYLDLVTHSDGSFVAITDVPAGTSLYNTAYWQIVAKSGAYRWGDISGDLANQTDLQNALNAKADESSTYTKTEVNNLLDSKQDELTFDNNPTANSDNPVKSSGIKTALDAKADASGVYTKSETDDFIDDLQDQIDNINKFDIHICTSGEYDPTTYIPTVANPEENTFYLVPTGTGTDMYAEWIYENNKWEKFGVNSIDLNAYYTKTETNTLLGNKADKTTTYTKTETDALLDEKADTTDVTAALALKADASAVYTKQESDTLLNAKANSTDVTTALALKSDKTETYTKTETDTLLDTKQDTLTFDNVPTAGSNNPVKSSGIKSALDEKANSTDVYTKTESDALLDAKVTDNIELTSTATQNYTAGSLAIVQNQLIRVTQNIATGGSITIGSNAETIDLETLIAEKAEKILVAKLPFLSSADLYNNTADFHNAMPRGKDITSYLTDGSLWDRINGANGYSLFEDLYVGDYLTAGGQDYMIVDFDYYIRCGDGMDITQHHLVMMPTGNMSIPEGTVLYGSENTLTLINTANYREHTGDDTVTVSSQETAVYKKWNATIDAPNTNTTAGGYKFSRMRQVIMKAADTIIVNAFGLAHIKPIPVLYPNPANAEASGLASNWTWYKDTDWTSDLRRSICDLPNETQIYGQQVWGKGSAWNTGGHEVGVDKWQFALFKNNRARANIRAHWWLRSVYSAAHACIVTYNGYAINYGTSFAIGVRPRFLLFG